MTGSSMEMSVLTLRMSLSLLLVVGLIYLSAWLLRLYGRRHGGFKGGASAMRLLQTLPLGGGRFAHLIAVGRRVIVVSAGGHRSTLLMELSTEEAKELELSVQASPEAASGLPQLLARLKEIRRPGSDTNLSAVRE